MTSAVDQLAPSLGDFDLWAIQVAVREGKPMNLTRREQIVAAHLMRRKGIEGSEQARRLKVSRDLIGKFWRLDCPVDINDIPAEISGAPVPPSRQMSRADVRRITGT